jgi:N-methylhydantoinase A
MRVGFDIGGTFTDVIVADDNGELKTVKVLSLIDQVGEDISTLLQSLGPDRIVHSFVHGTTIASNAVIENTTALTGCITTKGFRDELEMRGQKRPNIYDVSWDRLPPLVPRYLRLEVDERILADGRVEKSPNPNEVRAVIGKLLENKVEAIAICLINSYLNPLHEQMIEKLVREIDPETVVCTSCDVHPEIREYERASTTVINASLRPVVERYLDRLQNRLSRYSNVLLVMQSNGGIMSAAAARRKPIYIVESGPAAGVLAAARVARENKLAAVLSLDMGGTTAKACLIENYSPLEKSGGEIGGGATAATRLFGGGGHALRVPSIDIVEVGAGGGSIAWIDQGGYLRVGPRSAGAEPGPVCYDRGGQEPTVTDANVVLGYMNPTAIAGSTLRIDKPAAWRAIERQLAQPLGLDVLRVAYGVSQVANSSMMRALRAVSTERGRDPRDFSLLAFGGAGPIHAAALADNMSITRVVIPPYPGLFSALGLLLADYRHDYITSIATSLDVIRPEDILERYAELKAKAVNEMREEGVSQEAIQFEEYIDLKYAYQLYEMTLPFPAGAANPQLRQALSALFTEAHKTAYSYYRDDPIEVVSLRLHAVAPAASGTLQFSHLTAQMSSSATANQKNRTREAYFGPDHGLVKAMILSRAELGQVMPGPVIIEEPDTTVVVPPDWNIARDERWNLVLTRV